MTEAQEIHPSPECIVVLPQQMHVIYDERAGTEVVGLYVDDPRLGEVLLAMTPRLAAAAVGNIATVLANLEALRETTLARRREHGDA